MAGRRHRRQPTQRSTHKGETPLRQRSYGGEIARPPGVGVIAVGLPIAFTVAEQVIVDHVKTCGRQFVAGAVPAMPGLPTTVPENHCGRPSITEFIGHDGQPALNGDAYRSHAEILTHGPGTCNDNLNRPIKSDTLPVGKKQRWWTGLDSN